MTSLNSLNYLRRIRIENELDNIIITHLKLTNESSGIICKKCGIIQGKSFKGFNRYYCRHLTKKIDNELKKENRLIAMKVMDLMYQDVGIIA